MTAQPFKGRKGFDANNERIQNIATAIKPTDGIPLAQMQEYVNKKMSQAVDGKSSEILEKSSTLKQPVVICTNKQNVMHSLVDGHSFTVSNLLAEGNVSLSSRYGLINPFVDSSETVGRGWTKLDIPEHAYDIDSSQGHLLYSKQTKKLYVLGENLGVFIDKEVQNFSTNSSGSLIAYISNGELFKTDIESGISLKLLDHASTVNVQGNSIVVTNSAADVIYSLDAGATFKKMNKLIPANNIVATSLEPCIYRGKQIQFAGNVHTSKGYIRHAVSTTKGILFVSDEQGTCSLHLMDQNEVTVVKEFDGYYQSFDSNYDLSKIVMLVRGCLSTSSKFGFWSDYKTDIVASQISLTTDGESLLAVGQNCYISKSEDANPMVVLNGFTMKPNSTIDIVKSEQRNCYVVVNETYVPTTPTINGLRVSDIWIDDCKEEVIYPVGDINAYLPSEPKDNTKCNISVILCEDKGTVTLKGSGLTLNNVENGLSPSFNYEGDSIYKLLEDDTWEMVENDDYDEFVKVNELILSHGKTYKFIYIKSKSGWYSY